MKFARQGLASLNENKTSEYIMENNEKNRIQNNRREIEN